jgi:hypothetical protein
MKEGNDVYALIYDEHTPARPLKRLISAHRSRKAAENELEKRIKRLGKRVWEGHMRIVWVDGHVEANDILRPSMFVSWRDGDKIPWEGR